MILGVPPVTDRFIQQAMAQVLTPIYEEKFHDNYGFRQEEALIKPYSKVYVERRLHVDSRC